MSAEIMLHNLALPALDDDHELATTDDATDGRVRDTADDRPSHDSLPAMADPAADHRDQAVSERRVDVDEKHRRVAEFLDATGYEALVLGRADWVAWFTSGGDLGESLGGDASTVWLYVNRHSRAVLADNVQSARVFEEELGGLGFHLKERRWHEEPEATIAALARGKPVAADQAGLGRLVDERPRLLPMRLSLTKLDRQRLRMLGRTLTLAVEATCRNFERDETEADLAGHLAHRLFREGVVPVDVRVAGDDRLARYRQPTFKAAPIRRRATIAATGRRHGLCASVTRTVALDPVGEAFRRAHGLAAMVDATCIFFSRPGQSVADVLKRGRRIYEKFGHPHEWTLDYQGSLTGYAPREVMIRPDSPWVLGPHTAVRWGPSVGAARSEDTIVIDQRGVEIVTEAQRWPKVDVLVKGFPISRPGILER